MIPPRVKQYREKNKNCFDKAQWDREKFGLRPPTLRKLVEKRGVSAHFYSTNSTGYWLTIKTLKHHNIPFVAFQYTSRTTFGVYRIVIYRSFDKARAGEQVQRDLGNIIFDTHH